MRLKLPACRAAVSSVPNESVTPDARLPSSEAEKPQKDARPAMPGFSKSGFSLCREEGVKLTMARNSCPKVAFALSHVELNPI
jgi:hypothetical protein